MAALLAAEPGLGKAVNNHNALAMHVGAITKASVEVMELLVAAFPAGVHAETDSRLTPLQDAKSGRAPDAGVVTLLEVCTTSQVRGAGARAGRAWNGTEAKFSRWDRVELGSVCVDEMKRFAFRVWCGPDGSPGRGPSRAAIRRGRRCRESAGLEVVAREREREGIGSADT